MPVPATLPAAAQSAAGELDDDEVLEVDAVDSLEDDPLPEELSPPLAPSEDELDVVGDDAVRDDEPRLSVL
jgi:hypothetical protein